MVIIQTKGNTVNGYTTYFNLYAGDNVDVTLVFSVDGVALDLTGYDIKMTIGFDTPLLLDIDNGGIVIDDAAAGIARIVIPSATTENWKPCSFPFDFWLFPTDAVANNWMNGFFVIKRGETVIA